MWNDSLWVPNKLWKDSTRKKSVKIRVKESREFDEKEIEAGTKDRHSLVNHPQNRRESHHLHTLVICETSTEMDYVENAV